jgi:predicted anti-sigma-YlaC factor YlaD
MNEMSFDCRRFEEVLEAFLDGTLTGQDALAAREHRRTCADCNELVEIAGAPMDAAPDLAAHVLAHTSGSPCDRASEGLCDLVDGRAAAVDVELIGMHVSNCEACSTLSNVLTELATDLPALAEMNPGERFTAEVLARTLPRGEDRPNWIEQLVQGWNRLIRRPRFALEGAYVMTLLMLVILGVPGALLAGAPGKMAQTAKREIAEPVQQTVVELKATVSERAQQTLDTTGARVADEARSTANGLTAYSSRVFEKLKTGMGTFWSRLASGQANDDNNESSANDDGQDGDGR